MKTTDNRSEAESVAAKSPAALKVWMRQNVKRLPAIEDRWDFWARKDQLPPEGDWRTWLLMAGRGFGKTRTGAEWVRAQAKENGDLRIALVAATLAEARSVMVEGVSGLLNLDFDPKDSPVFEPSLRRLIWPSGAIATLYSAAEPDSLRGPEHHIAWADEVAKWSDGVAAWDNLELTLRLGDAPRIVATTTPRTVPLVRKLMALKDVTMTRGRMNDNRINLPRSYVSSMQDTYGGTRTGRQELDGELLEDIDGALWTRAMIEAARFNGTPPQMVRTVVAVDPPASKEGDACGIAVVGRDDGGLIWLLADETVSGQSPHGWARAVARAYHHWQADRVIAEKNNGGDMVESVLRTADAALPVRLVHATHGKSARAEPVVSLYEQGRVRHVGAFPALEDQLCGMMAAGGYEGPGRSPDRADALVWGVWEIGLQMGRGGPRVRWV
jgi:phage terminase large subunit-like protein